MYRIGSQNKKFVTPLFSSCCLPLSKILFYAMLFPFCSRLHDFFIALLQGLPFCPCHLFTSHYKTMQDYTGKCLPAPYSSFSPTPSLLVATTTIPPPLLTLCSSSLFPFCHHSIIQMQIINKFTICFALFC